MRESYDLAWITAYLYARSQPLLRSTDDMAFLKVSLKLEIPTDVLYMYSCLQ